MVIVEKSFPRGGIASAEAKASSTATNIIFGATQKKPKKPKQHNTKKSFTNFNDNNEEQLQSISAKLLNYDTVQEGMNIIGVVKKTDTLYLDLSLPGRIIARVMATEISDAYTKKIEKFVFNAANADNSYKTLPELYSVGQIVYARVQSIVERPNGRKHINMTMKPAEVHADLQHMNIKKGFNFIGAINEIQEHGYIIESGIRNLRTFLPKERSLNKNYIVGELIFLRVEKITHDKVASTCFCRHIKSENVRVKTENEANVDYILPANTVQFKISKILKDGLQGSIMNGSLIAYINEHHLTDALALPEDYEINQQLSARVLYVMPLTKFIYLSLNLRETYNRSEQEEHLKKGDIIENACVHHMGTGGIILILNNKFKGIISYKTVKANYKGNYDEDQLLNKYAKQTKHKVRILNYNLLDSLYTCTDNPLVLNEKIFSLENLHPGDFVTATLKAYDNKINGYLLQIGFVNGIIEQLFLAPNTKNLEQQKKVRCRVISVDLKRKLVYLTNRSEYMAQNSKILTNLADAKVNRCFTGTIVKCEENFILVRFFNGLKGVLNKQNLNFLMASDTKTFYEGQTMKFRIAKRKDEQIMLNLPEDTFNLGDICTYEVVNTLDSGLEIKISCDYIKSDADDDKEDFKGLVPIRLLSDYTDLLFAKRRILLPQTTSEAVCITKNIFSICDVDYYRNNVTKEWNNVFPGDIIRSYIKNVHNDIVEIMVPIRNYNKLVKVHFKMLLMQSVTGVKIELTPDQVIYVKVLDREPITKTITVSAKLIDIWNGELSITAQYVESYLKEIDHIKQGLKAQNAPIAKYDLGDKLTIYFTGVHPETNDWLYQVETTKVLAVLKYSLVRKCQLPEVGEKQESVVLWVDYSNDLLLISNKSFDVNHITKDNKLAPNLVNQAGISAKVLLKMDNIAICSLKKSDHSLVYCPIRLHYNDFEQSCSHSLIEGNFCKLAFIHETLPIAVPENVWKLWKDIKRKTETEAALTKRKLEQKEKTQLKRKPTEKAKENDNKRLATKISKEINAEAANFKALEDNSTEPIQSKLSIVETIKSDKKGKRSAPVAATVTEIPTKKSKIRSNSKSSQASSIPPTSFFEDKKPNQLIRERIVEEQKPKPASKFLPGIENFWNIDSLQMNGGEQQSESSDDEEIDENVTQRRKRKLTAKEKFKLQREEEARLRAIEAKYADPNYIPETIDEFDRAVLGEPNNSKIWIRYMAYHLQNTEIELARAVARRALKTISFRKANELLNIWTALLNLELHFGDNDKFNDTLKEALTFNEPLKVYLRTMKILLNVKRINQLIDVMGTLTRKFKDEPEVWRAVANAYFTIDMPDRAQQQLHRALTCLPEREHVNTIVAFANLNHKYGNSEMAQTLLDQVVTSYPKRVDVWTQYVDLLIKSELIEPARNLLERAAMQKIPLKKMRTIFKKFLEFEQCYGTEDTVQKVKQQAIDFVKMSTTL